MRTVCIWTFALVVIEIYQDGHVDKLYIYIYTYAWEWVYFKGAFNLVRRPAPYHTSVMDHH